MTKTSFFYFLLATILIIACDEVDDPFADSRVEVSDEFGDPIFNDTITVSESPVLRKILIEDFTGHTCPNCPAGARLAKSVQDAHPKNVIISAIHNSITFSKPDPDKGFPADYETETGENLRSKFQIENFPAGMVDRLPIGTNESFQVSWTLWQSEVEALLDSADYMNPEASIDLTVVYNTDIRLLRVFPKVEILRPLSGSLFLSNFILENGIISPQIDSRATPSKVDDYEHNHTLRAGFESDDVGSLLFENPSVGDTYQNDTLALADINIDESWNAANLEVLSVLYHAETKRIIQSQLVTLQ